MHRYLFEWGGGKGVLDEAQNRAEEIFFEFRPVIASGRGGTVPPFRISNTTSANNTSHVPLGFAERAISHAMGLLEPLPTSGRFFPCRARRNIIHTCPPNPKPYNPHTQ